MESGNSVLFVFYLYNVYIDGKVMSWTNIKLFFDLDKKRSIEAAPRLINSLKNPTAFEKIKIKLVTQILSGFVSTGMHLYLGFSFFLGKLWQHLNF